MNDLHEKKHILRHKTKQFLVLLFRTKCFTIDTKIMFYFLLCLNWQVKRPPHTSRLIKDILIYLFLLYTFGVMYFCITSRRKGRRRSFVDNDYDLILIFRKTLLCLDKRKFFLFLSTII